MLDGIREQYCVRCFFAIQDNLARHAEKFQSKYDLVPGFRAGLHCGEVTTGEVGALKKEIIFTGDVLNTTARIQGLTKEHGHDLMLSETLVSKLPEIKDYTYVKEGEVHLRGKQELVSIYRVSRSGHSGPV